MPKGIAQPLSFVQVKGFHSLWKKPMNGFSVDAQQREQYFSSAADIEFLLRSHPSNPLLKEGDIQMERKGEYFITSVVLSLLLARDIKKYQERHAEDIYNTKNVFIVSNDLKVLSTLLSNLHLKVGEDAKIVYIDDVHAVAFYLRNDGGKFKCYIGDSQGPTYVALAIADAVTQSLKKVNVFIGSMLQRDNFSCFTIAKKSIQYFIKHGPEIFAHIASAESRAYGNYRVLPLTSLMPTLLKLCQHSLSTLPNAAMDAIVSSKAQLTLRDYLEKHAHVVEGKNFYAAAIEAKYRYFSQVNELLSAGEIDEEILQIAFHIFSRPAMLHEKLMWLKAHKANSEIAPSESPKLNPMFFRPAATGLRAAEDAEDTACVMPCVIL